jgi:hypothetical protein
VASDDLRRSRRAHCTYIPRIVHVPGAYVARVTPPCVSYRWMTITMYRLCIVSVADRCCTAFHPAFHRSAWVPHPTRFLVWWDLIKCCAARPCHSGVTAPPPTGERGKQGDATTYYYTTHHISSILPFTSISALREGFAYHHTSHIATHPHHHPVPIHPVGSPTVSPPAKQRRRHPRLPRSFLFDTLVPPRHPRPGYRRVDSLEQGSALGTYHPSSLSR